MSDHVRIGGSLWSFNMNKLTTLGVVIAVLSGCASAPLDVSTGEETASIEGLPNISGRCGIHHTLPTTWRELSPGARALVVDAGPVEIWARCENMGFFGDVNYLITFRFVAETGHIYKLRRRHQKGPNCLELIDASVGDRVIACEPYSNSQNQWIHSSYENWSAGDETAFIRPGRASSDTGHCRHRKRSSRSSWLVKGDLLEVDAGPITIDVTCATGLRKPRWRTLTFDFVAGAGHTYTFTDSHEDCVRLLDITSEEVLVVCRPYDKVE